MTRLIHALSEISDAYDALFVDLWGCVHDGVRALPDACAALVAYRATGGTVVLVTNSPRPRGDVERQLRHFGVPDAAWDTIATSGDSARAAMFRGVVGRRVWFVGQPQEGLFFEPIKVVDNPVEITRVALDEAEGIVCTGPFDPLADPAVMRPQFLAARTRGLKLLCANPDIVVDRGAVREWCAGALARLYTEMGGESLYFGKPHPPIYDLARRRLAALERDVPEARILCVGDGIHTDVQGAVGEDLDVLFVAGGLAAEETLDGAHPHSDRLDAWLATKGYDPTYSIGFLR